MKDKTKTKEIRDRWFKGVRDANREALTVYTVLKHVSRSGMKRVIDVYVIRDNRPYRLSWSAAELMGWTYDRNHEGIVVGGCGMDMGFHLVYSLSYVLFKNTARAKRKGRDPGYVLNHEWIG